MNEDRLRRFADSLGCSFDVHAVEETGSTNDDLKRLAAAGAAHGYALAAGRQSAGKGTRGHSFFSPKSGVYISVLLRPKTTPEQTARFTATAGVAVCRAIEKLTPRTAQIKWVNDIYIDGRKVSGILTEASVEKGLTAWAVIGIGINITEPEGGFPEEIRQRACALFGTAAAPADFAERLAAEVLAAIEKQLSAPWAVTLDEYRRRSYLTGKEVTLSDGTAALVTGIADDGSLLVTDTANGISRTIGSQYSVREIVVSE